MSHFGPLRTFEPLKCPAFRLARAVPHPSRDRTAPRRPQRRLGLFRAHVERLHPDLQRRHGPHRNPVRVQVLGGILRLHLTHSCRRHFGRTRRYVSYLSTHNGQAVIKNLQQRLAQWRLGWVEFRHELARIKARNDEFERLAARQTRPPPVNPKRWPSSARTTCGDDPEVAHLLDRLDGFAG